MPITIKQAKEIAEKTQPFFKKIKSRYDEKKYSPKTYRYIKDVFSNFSATDEDISDALIWKYGHVKKNNFIGAHKNIIKEVQLAWPDFIKSNSKTIPEETFNWWRNKLEKNTKYGSRFITEAFITHLIHYKEIPIIDHNNFRAMNNLILAINPNYKFKKKPSQWKDVQNLSTFIKLLINHLSCTESDLDRFLMILGKDIKNNKNIMQDINKL